MPSRCPRESLKRRREGYQLSLQHCAELRRHRCSRSEASPTTESHCPFPHLDTRTEPTHSALSMPAAVDEQRGAAAPGFTSSNPLLCEKPHAHLSLPYTAQVREWCRPGSPATESAADALTLRLRPVRVDVVRGDTGRRSSFSLQTSFLYAWRRGNHFYRSLDGEQVGLELQEAVVCHVLPVVAVAPLAGSSEQMMAYGTGVAFNAPWCQLESRTLPTTGIAGSARRNSGGASSPSSLHTSYSVLLHNEEAMAAAAGSTSVPANPSPAPSMHARTPTHDYSYEATQISRCLAPPSYPHSHAGDVCTQLGSCSPSLFVDCLLKCVHDEAVLPDDHGWVHLYRGRHMLTEGGRSRLLQDLFAHAYYPVTEEAEESAPPVLTVCVFRKC